MSVIQDYLDACELNETQHIPIPIDLIRSAYLERDLEYNTSLQSSYNKITHMLNQSQRTRLQNAIQANDRQAFYQGLNYEQLLYLGW